MSTVPEVIVADHMGLRVLAISCVTNMAAGISPKKIDHREVIETGNSVRSRWCDFSKLCCPDWRMRMDKLAESALLARKHARAPLSNFKVGAAIEDETGRIHTGCNIENATYGLTICAERVALFKAISEGAKNFRRIAGGVAIARFLTPPCGACRQILWEFCGDIEIVLVNSRGKSEVLQLKDLFPRPFDATFLS